MHQLLLGTIRSHKEIWSAFEPILPCTLGVHYLDKGNALKWCFIYLLSIRAPGKPFRVYRMRLFIYGVAKWLLGTSRLLLSPSVFKSGPSATRREDGFTEVCHDCVLGTEAPDSQELDPCHLACSESPQVALTIGKV